MCLLLQTQIKKLNVQENPRELSLPLLSLPLAFIIKLFISQNQFVSPLTIYKKSGTI